MPDRGNSEIKCSQVQEGFKAEGMRDYRGERLPWPSSAGTSLQDMAPVCSQSPLEENYHSVRNSGYCQRTTSTRIGTF